jgi:hypothetical protein
MILFLIDKVNARWEYTFEFIFDLRGVDYQLTDNPELFEQSKDTKFKVPSRFGRLLLGKEIHSEMKETDILSKLFFVLTRMEEYSPVALDKLNRFSAKNSWQYKNDLLEKCVCDQWALEFIALVETTLDLKIGRKPASVEIIPSFDIDNAFAYKYKTGKRRVLSLMKDVFNRNGKRIKERNSVLKGEQKDPYDSFDKILKIAAEFPVRLFWLVGDYGQPDYNISIETKEMDELVKRLNEKMKIGIHPSFRSNKKAQLLPNEIHRLENVKGASVDISRQHFLKLSFPSTYQELIRNHIKQDYTMGFADAVGFRNGTAHAFPWFDLTKNEKSDVLMYPFAYMDGTLNEYLKLSPLMANLKIEELFLEVKKYGGQFSFIWHNETISEYGIWKGWSSVLDYTLTLSTNTSK